MVTRVIDLDLSGPCIVPMIHVSKLDSGLRAFEFHLYDSGELYQIPSNVTITFQGTKPDKNGFVYGCTFENNIVRVNCTEQMTAVEGVVKCDLILVDRNENRIASFLMHLFVHNIAVDDDTVFSDSDLDYIQQVLNKIQSNGTLQFINYSSETIYLRQITSSD